MLFRIKLAEISDAKEVFRLSNDPTVRQNSFNTKQILWEDHIKWFTGKVKDKNCVFYIVRNGEDKFIGQVRFDKMVEERNVFLIGISVMESFRGKGLGSLILKKCTNKLLQDFHANKVYAFIKENNQASLKSFLKVGYKVVSKEIVKGEKAFRLSYENV